MINLIDIKNLLVIFTLYSYNKLSFYLFKGSTLSAKLFKRNKRKFILLESVSYSQIFEGTRQPDVILDTDSNLHCVSNSLIFLK